MATQNPPKFVKRRLEYVRNAIKTLEQEAAALEKLMAFYGRQAAKDKHIAELEESK